MNHSMISHLFQASIATGAIFAVEAIHDFPTDWIQMVERLGLAIALVLFFVWTGWKREQRMGLRIDKLERDNYKLAERTSALTEQVSIALQRETSVVAEALKVLSSRTCWAFQSREEFDEMKRQLDERQNP